jgi:TIR domain
MATAADRSGRSGLRIFLNYRREDAADAAGRLSDALAAHFGTGHVFMDIDAIEPGVDFEEVVNEAVGKCDVLIAVIGRHWLTVVDHRGRRRLDNPDDYVRMELQAALDRNVRVIPVLVQGVDMPSSDDLPDALKKLARRNAVEVSSTRWRYDIGRLTAALERITETASEQRQRAETSLYETVEPERAEAERVQQTQQPLPSQPPPSQPPPSQPPPSQPPPSQPARSRKRAPLILLGIIALVGIAVGALAASGAFSSGGTTSKSTPASSAQKLPAGAVTSCGGDLSVGPNTSCPFAQNVERAYAKSSGGNTDVSAYSPATGATYTMHCSGSSPHVCTGGNNASVYFTSGPNTANAAAGTTAPAASGLPQSCGTGVNATQSLSCALANNVFYEYYKATQNGGSGTTVSAWSPATKQYYSVSCSTGAGLVKCAIKGTTDPSAEVDLTQAALSAYTSQQASSYAAKADLGPNG